MLLKTPKISFFIRPKKDKENRYGIYCRITFNGHKNEFSLKETISKDNWCIKAQRVKNNVPQKKYLDHLQETIMYKIKIHAISNEDAMPVDLIRAIHPQSSQSINELSLEDICRKYIDNCIDELGTVRNHEIKLKNLQLFSSAIKTNYTAEQFTIQVASNFIDWFCVRNRTKNITSANRNVLFYKMCCKWFRKKGNKIQTELFNFDGEKDKIKPPVFLSEYELKTVRNKVFESSYLRRNRDLFIFQCYTGLSYCDLWSDWEITKEDFGTVLTGVRGKNGNSFWIPIEDNIVIEILKKYNYELPKYENAVYNRTLKEIMALCGIKKRITTHTARKTFATLMDANGWSRETVSKMLGHSSVKTTELYYLGQSFARLENEFRQRNAM